MSLPESSSTRLSLISRIRANDSRAWQDLVALYSPLIAFWCRKQQVSESEINDAVQEVFFSVSRAIDNYQPRDTGGGFRSWLWTITRHKIIDAKRRDARLPLAQGGSTAYYASQQVPEELDDQDDSERFEFTQLLHRGLAQVESEFEPKTWQAFWRCTVDGQAVASVAAELGISASTVRQHRARVLRRLRQQLGDQFLGDPVQSRSDDRTNPIQSRSDGRNNPIQSRSDDSTNRIQSRGDDRANPIQSRSDDRANPIQSRSDDRNNPDQSRSDGRT